MNPYMYNTGCEPCQTGSLPIPIQIGKCVVRWTVSQLELSENELLVIAFNGLPPNQAFKLNVKTPQEGVTVANVVANSTGTAQISMQLKSGPGDYIISPEVSCCTVEPCSGFVRVVCKSAQAAVVISNLNNCGISVGSPAPPPAGNCALTYTVNGQSSDFVAQQNTTSVLRITGPANCKIIFSIQEVDAAGMNIGAPFLGSSLDMVQVSPGVYESVTGLSTCAVAGRYKHQLMPSLGDACSQNCTAPAFFYVTIAPCACNVQVVTSTIDRVW